MGYNKMTPAPWVAGGTYPYKGNEGYIFDTSRPEILVCKTFGSTDENSPSIGEQAANSKAIVTAVNFTYGASINPEAVPELLSSIKEMMRFEPVMREGGAEALQYPDNFLKAILATKAAIEKAKL